jgi:hypothetical protein
MAEAKFELYKQQLETLIVTEASLLEKRNEYARKFHLTNVRDAGGLAKFPPFKETTDALERIQQMKKEIVAVLDRLHPEVKRLRAKAKHDAEVAGMEGSYRCPNCGLTKLLEGMQGLKNDLD